MNKYILIIILLLFSTSTFSQSKKAYARQRAEQLLQSHDLVYGPEGRTYQLINKNTGEVNIESLIGVDVNAGLFSKNRRLNKLISRELIMQNALLPKSKSSYHNNFNTPSHTVSKSLYRFDVLSYIFDDLSGETHGSVTFNDNFSNIHIKFFILTEKFNVPNEENLIDITHKVVDIETIYESKDYLYFTGKVVGVNNSDEWWKLSCIIDNKKRTSMVEIRELKLKLNGGVFSEVLN